MGPLGKTFRRIAAPLAAFGTLALLLASAAVWTVWRDRESTVLQSYALGEELRVSIYNRASNNRAPVLVVLDGEKWRHGLATAAQGRLLSWVSRSAAPMVIAIDGMGSRDGDLRNAVSEPAHWRPTISGRAADFDRFLLQDVFPFAKIATGGTPEIYLFGHSLAGLYAVDFATRHSSAPGFAGIAAFSPTFSHDLGVIDRLPRL